MSANSNMQEAIERANQERFVNAAKNPSLSRSETSKTSEVAVAEEEEYEGDYRCEVSEDTRCRAEATRVVREPYTPAAFQVLCCDEHAADLLSGGYTPDAEADKQLAADRKAEAEYFERDYMDRTYSTEADRLGERQ